MTGTSRWYAAAVAGAVLVACAPAGAQDAAADTEELVALQKLTKKEFSDLTDKMVEVADLLAESDPESARVIRQAVRQAQSAFLAQRMDEVAEHLTRGMDAAAVRGEEEVVADLRRLLETLLHGGMDPSERAERIRRWRQLLERIDRMLEQQRDLERTSNAGGKRQELEEQLGEMARRLEDIVERQKELLEDTESLGEPDATARRLSELRGRLRRLVARQRGLREDCGTAPVNRLPVAAGAQKQLAEVADQLAEGLEAAVEDEQLASRLADAGAEADALLTAADLVGSAAGEMTTAGEALARSEREPAGVAQEQALAELTAAEKALTGALEPVAKDTPAGKLAGAQRELADRTGELRGDVESAAAEAGVEPKAGNLASAAEQMNKAGEKLTENDAGQAAGLERRALKELADEGYELAQLHRRIRRKAEKPPEAQAGEQSDLAEQARSTAEQMSEKDDRRSAPGGSSVGSAAESMDSAAGKLAGGACGGANADQDEAVRQLEDARQELADAVAREQEMLQAEQLASIEQMLQQILSAQQDVSAGTKEVRAARDEAGYARPERLRLAELSDAEGALAEDTGNVLDMLAEEGTSVVFPGVLEEVRDNLGDVQTRLADRDAGERTQALQAGVEADLRAMLDAIRKELSRRRRQGGAGGGPAGGGGGGGPLIPPVAELKMLRLLQLRIQARTETLAESAGTGELSADELAERHEELSRRQRRLREMTREVAERMEAAGGRGTMDVPGGQ
jgi:dsDNA-binding SOS-regulon protein